VIYVQLFSVTIYQEIFYTLSENENKNVAENNATANLKNRLMEDAVNVILSKRNNQNIQLTEPERKSIAQAVQKMQILEQNWNGDIFYLSGQIEIDLEEINNSQKANAQDEDPIAVLERIRKYRDDAQKTIEQLEVMENRRQRIGIEAQQKSFDNFRQGRLAQILRHYETSIYYFNKALEFDKNHPQAHFYIGFAHTILGNHLEAIKSYRKALKHDIAKEKVYFNMGISYDEINNQDKAIEAYLQTIKLSPNYFQAYYNLGSSYLLKRDFKKAIESYEKVLEFNPEFSEVYFNLGYIYDEQKNYEKAIEKYQIAISLNPKYAGAYLALGYAFFRNKQYNDAITSLEKASTLDDKDPEIFIKLGNAYEAVNDEKKVIEAYQNAARLDNKKAQKFLEKKQISW
jgi:tetratricopeptide (TPR) repeat protein